MKNQFTALRLGVLATAAALALTACGSTGGNGSAGTTAATDQTSPEATATASAEESYTIGVSQLVSHPALDAIEEGFEEAFTDAGVDVTFDVKNAQGEVATASSIASSFAGNADIDLVAAITTPSAQATASAIRDRPVVFVAVTDPLAAGLVESLEAPGGNVTGTSDMNPVKEQLQLLKDVDPEVRTVGIVWNSAETNSKVQVDMAKEVAAELGLEIKDVSVTNSSEVAQGVQTLSDVDGIYVPIDNAVVSALETVVQFGQDNQIPVVAANIESVERGALGTYGIDQKAHGRMAGELALRILRDDLDPATTPVEFAQEDSLQLVLNPEAAAAFGVEIPQDVLDRADEVIEPATR
ncbi:MAG: ABC transporter substrate-binding protein [Micrococcus sp.]|nr:ABC transporter substrate-binding protein [Micrococcus sp.]